MSVKYFVSDANGNIIRYGLCPASMVQDQADPGEIAVQGEAKDSINYYDAETQEIKFKTRMQISVNGATVSGIPAGAKIIGEGMSQTINDGVVNYSSNRKGTHRLRIEHKEYITENVDLVI